MNTEYWGAPSQREADPLHHEKVSAYGIHLYIYNYILCILNIVTSILHRSRIKCLKFYSNFRNGTTLDTTYQRIVIYLS